MLFWTIVRVAFRSLLAHKLRSFLAMLGIIIGVSAVISMLALGAGAQKQIMDRIESMGTNQIIVRPGQRGSRGVMSGSNQNLTLDTAAALFQEIPEIHQISPIVRGNTATKMLEVILLAQTLPILTLLTLKLIVVAFFMKAKSKEMLELLFWVR